jgi:hypothetical protein
MVTALLVSALVAASCEATGRNAQTQNVSNPRPVHCTIIADVPRRDDANPPKSIVSRVRFRCDRPGAETLTLTLRLERQSGTAWRTVRSQSFTFKGEQSHAEFFKYRNRQLTVGCSAGRFRTTVVWSRSSRGASRKGTAQSIGVLDPCAPRLFS